MCGLFSLKRFFTHRFFKIFPSITLEMDVASSTNSVPGEIIDPLKNIVIDTIPYTIVSEGKAEVLFPSSHDVFYNPVQEFNRDISIAILKQFINEIPLLNRGKFKNFAKYADEEGKMPGIRVLEALAASGLRSIRFAKEVSGIKEIIANDMASQAYSSIQRNITHNTVEEIVKANCEDASLFMYKNRQFKDRFDVVDLDPYGTATPFLDAAVQCVVDGGLLMVTCTDMAILCGNGVEACHAKYGAISMKTGYCHEMALRILLQCIESHANRYGRYIEPILSLSADFYVRVFVQIFTGPVIVKQSICKLAMLYICPTCESFHIQPIGNKVKTDKGEKYTPGIGPVVGLKCNICNGTHKVCGPLWSANMHNKEFLQKVVASVESEAEQFKTSKRILGMLNVILEELDDCPLYYRLDRLTRAVHVVTPTNIQFRSAILNAGYHVSISHTLPISIKTDAPNDVIWDIIRAWAKEHPGKKTFEIEPSKTIMSKEPSVDVSFKTHPEAEPKSREHHLLRFQINPEPYWGPKCRASTSLFHDKEKEKQVKFQNKRKKREADGCEDGKKLKQNGKTTES